MVMDMRALGVNVADDVGVDILSLIIVIVKEMGGGWKRTGKAQTRMVALREK